MFWTSQSPANSQGRAQLSTHGYKVSHCSLRFLWPINYLPLVIYEYKTCARTPDRFPGYFRAFFGRPRCASKQFPNIVVCPTLPCYWACIRYLFSLGPHLIPTDITFWQLHIHSRSMVNKGRAPSGYSAVKVCYFIKWTCQDESQAPVYHFGSLVMLSVLVRLVGLFGGTVSVNRCWLAPCVSSAAGRYDRHTSDGFCATSCRVNHWVKGGL